MFQRVFQNPTNKILTKYSQQLKEIENFGQSYLKLKDEELKLKTI